MPNYDFYCKQCTCRFELMLPMSSIGTPAHDSPECPRCERNETKRVIKAPRLNMKPWRKRLVDEPFEVDAIEQGVYE